MQATPVFLPGESHGQRSEAGYNPQGLKELDMTEATEHAHAHTIFATLLKQSKVKLPTRVLYPHGGKIRTAVPCKISGLGGRGTTAP